MTDYKTLSLSIDGRIATIMIDRPDALNALNQQVMQEMSDAIMAIDEDPAIAVTILTGAGRAFAAGADIKEMQNMSFSEAFISDLFGGWEAFARRRKPVIAAVNGFALGGGCELAMMCDILIASDKAKFGQPEIKLGLIPGMGGSQRLTNIVGKAMAMDLILTGRMINADEALRIGLVSRLVPHADLMGEALAIATEISGYGLPAILSCKEVVDVSQELSLSDGLKHERRLAQALFSTHDQKEGMGAFVEKRAPEFKDS